MAQNGDRMVTRMEIVGRREQRPALRRRDAKAVEGIARHILRHDLLVHAAGVIKPYQLRALKADCEKELVDVRPHAAARTRQAEGLMFVRIGGPPALSSRGYVRNTNR